MNFVIGSGPAGTAAATALLEHGCEVTMLDAGGTLEPDIAGRADRMAQVLPAAWSSADRDALKGPLRYNQEGAPLKLAFGSDYVYRDVDRWLPVAARGVDAFRSMATGGLSVLWGGSVMPFSDTDFEGWPVGAADMREHYQAVLQLTGLAAEEDALTSLYPLHLAPTAPLELSRQASMMLRRAEAHGEALAARQVHVGRARLAFAAPRGAVEGCARCGLCLYGCPYGIIYSTQATVRHLAATEPRFTYVPGVVVRRLVEGHAGVVIEAVARDTQQPRHFDADRVYLGAGTLPSTAILLHSLPAAKPSVTLCQSDHFLLPLLLMGRVGHPSDERLHTLSQLYIELLDPAISRHGVHLQVYTYNDLYARMAQDRLGRLFPVVAPLVAAGIRRLALIKGYLHSGESDGIRASLEAGTLGPTLRLDAERNPASRRVIGAATAALRRNSARLGAWPLRVARRTGRPGSSVHVGGSVPMRRAPNGMESDLQGRPAGLRRVHVVDGSVFPTMPAASPTLTIMANARRIAVWSQRGQET